MKKPTKKRDRKSSPAGKNPKPSRAHTTKYPKHQPRNGAIREDAPLDPAPPAQRPADRRRNGQAGKPNGHFKVNSFFAGIGGFDLGFQRADFSPAFHCEINEFCQSVLQRHWPDLPYVGDILQITPSQIPDADVWCGGFPCQDVSVARGWLGRDGLKGRNSGLFYPFAKLVSTRHPQVVVMENVTGLLNSHDGADFQTILEAFDAMGYGVSWRVLNTRYFGAPQSRPRVYICCWLASGVKALNALYEPGKTVRPENQRLGFLRPTTCAVTGAHVPETAYCLAATSGRHTGTDWSRSYISYKDAVRRVTPSEAERLQGFPTDWTIPNEKFHLTDEEIDTLRYHALGNAVSVPVVEWVARRIHAELHTPAPLAQTPPNGWSLLSEASAIVRDFSPTHASVIKLQENRTNGAVKPTKWNTGGVMFNNICVMAPVSAAPVQPIASRFVDILDKHKVDIRYFLSPNAAKGILRRVDSQDRELFEPLKLALEQLSSKYDPASPQTKILAA